jgi:hypothetical protein
LPNRDNPTFAEVRTSAGNVDYIGRDDTFAQSPASLQLPILVQMIYNLRAAMRIFCDYAFRSFRRTWRAAENRNQSPRRIVRRVISRFTSEKKKKKKKKKKRKKKKEKKKEEGTVSRDAIARMIERCFDASPSAGVNKIQQWLASW